MGREASRKAGYRSSLSACRLPVEFAYCTLMLGDETVVAIAEAFKENTTLQTLALDVTGDG